MKMSTESLTTLRTAIEPHDTPELRESYRKRDIPRGDLVKDIDKRYRWDLLKLSDASWKFACEQYDLGLNDSHIDTALRSVVAPL
jgi:hypothetical protein